MHYHLEVYLKSKENFEEQIEQILAPFQEENSEDGWWDWYQIGGRWNGVHRSSYSILDDDNNYETCYLCNGTGFRNDALGQQARLNDPTYTCNGCGRYNHETKKWEHERKGPGKKLKFSGDFVSLDFNIMPISEIEEQLNCYTLIVNNEILHVEEFDGEHFVKTTFDGKVKQALIERGIIEGYVVTVDYHS